MRYGQKWLGKHRKMGSTYCAQCCPVFISSKNSVKIWPKKKLLRHRRYDTLRQGSKSHFPQKNAFFGQKMAFFWKIHFIQNSSVTKNTSYTCSRKKNFLLKLWFSNSHRIQPKYEIGRVWDWKILRFEVCENGSMWDWNCVRLEVCEIGNVWDWKSVRLEK